MGQDVVDLFPALYVGRVVRQQHAGADELEWARAQPIRDSVQFSPQVLVLLLGKVANEVCYCVRHLRKAVFAHFFAQRQLRALARYESQTCESREIMRGELHTAKSAHA